MLHFDERKNITGAGPASHEVQVGVRADTKIHQGGGAEECPPRAAAPPDEVALRGPPPDEIPALQCIRGDENKTQGGVDENQGSERTAP